MKTSTFLCFDRCKIADDGATVEFRYPAGVTYAVPTEYIVQWFKNPAGMREGEVLREWKRRRWTPPANPRVARARRILGRHVVRLYLVSGEVLDLVWDEVLMACEPRYEHFGGFTPKGRRLTRAAFRRWGGFRKPPG